MLESFRRLTIAGFTRINPRRFQRGDLIVEWGMSGDWYWSIGGVFEHVPDCDDPVSWIINDE